MLTAERQVSKGKGDAVTGRLSRPVQGVLLAGAAAALFALCYAAAGVLGPYSDLFPRWYGLRALLLEGRNPYDAAVAEAIGRQSALLGTEAPGTAIQTAYGFLYPLPGALLLSPLALLPFRAAHAVWLLFGALALPCAALLAFSARSGSGPRRWSALLCLPLAYVFVPSLWNLGLAQPGLAVLLLVAAAVRLRARRPGMAGACLAAALLLKPQLVVPLGPYWLAHAGLRWWRVQDASAARFLLGGTALCVALTALATLLVPSWPADYVGVAGQYAQVPAMEPLSPAVYVLSRLALPYPFAVAATAVIAGGLLVWAAAGWRDGEWPGISRAIVAGALVVPPAWETSGIVLLVPLAASLARLRPRSAAVLVASVAAVSVALGPLSLVWPWRNGALLAAAYAGCLAAAEALRRWEGRDPGAGAAVAAAPPAPEPPAPRPPSRHVAP